MYQGRRIFAWVYIAQWLERLTQISSVRLKKERLKTSKERQLMLCVRVFVCF